MPEETEGLPEAHPDFSAHFTNSIYDADDVEIVTVRHREGYDELHDWVKRPDELQTHPSRTWAGLIGPTRR